MPIYGRYRFRNVNCTMKNTSFALLILLSFGILHVSAQTEPAAGNPLFRHLPPDANQVYQINFPVIASKVDWKSIVPGMPMLNATRDPKIAAFIGDPSRAGIDIHRDFFVTLSNSPGLDSPRYVTILLPLSDSAKFIRFLKEEDKSGGFTVRPGKIRTAREKNTGFAWNDKLAVITFFRPPLREAMGKTGAHPVTRPANNLLSIRRSVVALAGYARSPFLTDTLFRDGFSDDADVHVWSSQGSGLSGLMQGLKTLPLPMQANLLNAAQTLKSGKSRTLGTIRFENGRIVYRNRTPIEPQAAGLMAQFNSRPLNTDLINRLPQGRLLGLVTLHIDVNALLSGLDRYKSRQATDSMLARMNLTSEELAKAFAGDLLIAAIGPDKPAAGSPGSDPTGNASLKPVFYGLVTINDPSSFSKVSTQLKLFKKDSIPARDSSGEAPGGKAKGHLFHTFRDHILVFGASQESTDGFFTNPPRGASDLVTEAVRDNPVAIVIDLKAVAAWLQASVNPQQTRGKDQQALAVLSKLDRISYSGGRLSGNEVESVFEVKMADPGKNSLASLLELFAQPRTAPATR